MAESLPSPEKYVDSALKTLFRETIDQLIADLGRPVKLYFEPSTSGCPNCFAGPDGQSNGRYDNTNPYAMNSNLHRAFADGTICPICRGTHAIKSESSATYTATIQRSPKELNYDALGAHPTNVYRTKMVIEAYDDLLRVKKALIDGIWCVRIYEPVKTGLKDLRYVRCYWQTVD
jgi:hypothetical protein